MNDLTAFGRKRGWLRSRRHSWRLGARVAGGFGRHGGDATLILPQVDVFATPTGSGFADELALRTFGKH